MGERSPEETARRAVEAVWRIEPARLVGALVRTVRDVGLAEDLAEEALIAALERWPETGVPENPGAWLMTIAKRRAIDALRRQQRMERKHGALEEAASDEPPRGPGVEARSELERAALMAQNDRGRALLLAHARACGT